MTACTTTGSVTSEAANPLLHWPVSMAVMAMNGEIHDAKTQILVLRAARLVEEGKL